MKKFLVLLISVAVSFIFTSTLHASSSIGKLTFVLGQVSIKSADQGARVAKQGDSVQVGDTIRSKIAAKAVISFNDGDIVRMAPKTKITIESYIPHDPVARIKIHLAGGKIQSSVKKPIKVAQSLNRYVVETPTTIIGVRGTVFFTTHISGVTTSLFTSGQGYGYNKNFPDKVEIINPGEVVEVRGANDQPVVRQATTQEIQQHTNDTSPDGNLGDPNGGSGDGEGGGDNTPPTTYVPPPTPDATPSITAFQDGVFGIDITGMELDLNSGTGQGVMGMTGMLYPVPTQLGQLNAVRDTGENLVGVLAGATGSWTGIIDFLYITPLGEVSYLGGYMSNPGAGPFGALSATGPVWLSDPIGMIDVDNPVEPDPFPDSTLANLTNLPLLGSMDFGDWIGPGESESAFDLQALTLDDPAGTIASVWAVVTLGGEFLNDTEGSFFNEDAGQDEWEIPYGYWDIEPGEENFKWAEMIITDDLEGHTSIEGSFLSLSAEYYGEGDLWGTGSYDDPDGGNYHSALAGTHTLTPLAFGGTATGNFYFQMESGAFLPPWRDELLNGPFPLDDPFAIHGALGGLETLWQEDAPFMMMGTFVEPDDGVLSRIDVDGTTEDGGVFRVSAINIGSPEPDIDEVGEFQNIGAGLFVRPDPEDQDDPQSNVAGLLMMEPFIGEADGRILMWRAEGAMTPVYMPLTDLAPGAPESLADTVVVRHAAATLNQHVPFLENPYGYGGEALLSLGFDSGDEGPVFGTITSTFENIPGQAWGTWTALTGGYLEDDYLPEEWTVTGATTPGPGLGSIDFSEEYGPLLMDLFFNGDGEGDPAELLASLEEQFANNTLPWGSTFGDYQDQLHQQFTAEFVDSMPVFSSFIYGSYEGLPDLSDVGEFFENFNIWEAFDVPGGDGPFIDLSGLPGLPELPSFEDFLAMNFSEVDFPNYEPGGDISFGQFLIDNHSEMTEFLEAEAAFIEAEDQFIEALAFYEDFVGGLENIMELHSVSQILVDGNTVTLGNPDGQLPGRYGISIMIPLSEEQGGTVNLQYDLNTEDYPNFDSFSVSLSELPYWLMEEEMDVELVDPLDDSEGLDVGFLWYGLGDDGALENLSGNQELFLPGSLDTDFLFLNIFLDTFTEPDSDEDLPSWGSFTINEPDNAQVVTLRGAAMEDLTIQGVADGAWVSWTDATTHVMAGQLVGTFDPGDAVWQAGIAGAWVETATFLEMASTEAGRATLAKINIPAFQVGLARLEGSAVGEGWSLGVGMTMHFFGYSNVEQSVLAETFAANDVSGTFTVAGTDTSVLLNQAVEINTLEGDALNSLNANFVMTQLSTSDAPGAQNGTWGGVIAGGNGSINVGLDTQQTIAFSGFAAGQVAVTNGEGVVGTFGGTAAGTVTPGVR